MSDKPPVRPVSYFAVKPDVYQRVINALATQPYNQVAGLLQDLTQQSRAMFDPYPDPPKFEGSGGRVVRVDQGMEDGYYRPGWTKHLLKQPHVPGMEQEFDDDVGVWWVKDPPDKTDHPRQSAAGGAE